MKLIIAKPGYNALTETDPDNLIFSSDYNTFKYFLNGSTTIYIPASASIITREDTIVTHDLGYYPFFVAFMEVNSDSGTYCNLPYSFADAGVYFNFFCYTTTTALILQTTASGLGTGIEFPVWYKIFKNNLGLS
jgi:hypothetical protein